MEPREKASDGRGVMVETVHGSVEGTLVLSGGLRTLDDLNVAGKQFLILRDPRIDGTGWGFGGGGQVMVNKSSILFLRETGGPPPMLAAGRPAGRRFSRATLRLRVGTFDIEGFVHVPPGGSAIARLNQGNHSFISLTSVSVVGPHEQFASPFLAVNRRHIVAAEERLHSEDAESDIELRFEVTD